MASPLQSFPLCLSLFLFAFYCWLVSYSSSLSLSFSRLFRSVGIVCLPLLSDFVCLVSLSSSCSSLVIVLSLYLPLFLVFACSRHFPCLPSSSPFARNSLLFFDASLYSPSPSFLLLVVFTVPFLFLASLFFTSLFLFFFLFFMQNCS